MNPLTNVRNQNLMNDREIELGISGTNKSWHRDYRESAWIFVGGFPYDLTEGDIVCVFSQYGEIVNINLVRDKKTGKTKGYGFICYEDQRSTDLAVDNFNGSKLLGRTLRVDHVLNYRPPKDHGEEDDQTKSLREKGCAPRISSSSEEDVDELLPLKKEKKKKDKKKKKKKSKHENLSDEDVKPKIKKEHFNPDYDKYGNTNKSYHDIQDVKTEPSDDTNQRWKHDAYEEYSKESARRHKDRRREQEYKESNRTKHTHEKQRHHRSHDRSRDRGRSRSRDRDSRSHEREIHKTRRRDRTHCEESDRARDRSGSRDRGTDRSRGTKKTRVHRRSSSREKYRSRSREKYRSRSRDRDRSRSRDRNRKHSYRQSERNRHN